MANPSTPFSPTSDSPDSSSSLRLRRARRKHLLRQQQQQQQQQNTPQAAQRHQQQQQQHSPEFEAKLRQMAVRLAPLVQVTSGLPHPDFPGTLLAFWLLTDAQLESLAGFYHQREPSRWTLDYPCPVWPRWGAPSSSSSSSSSAEEGIAKGMERKEATTEDKRRRFGRFIGLRGCESPTFVGGASSASEIEGGGGGGGDGRRMMMRMTPEEEEEMLIEAILEEARREMMMAEDAADPVTRRKLGF